VVAVVLASVLVEELVITPALLLGTVTGADAFVVDVVGGAMEGRIVVSPVPLVLEEIALVDELLVVGHSADIIPPFITIPSKVFEPAETPIQDVVTPTAMTLSAV
jgi:hypothetical protein